MRPTHALLMSLCLAALLDADSQRYSTASCQVASLHHNCYMFRAFGPMHDSDTSMLQSIKDSIQVCRGTGQELPGRVLGNAAFT